MPIALFAPAKEGDAQLALACSTTPPSEDDKKLAPEHWEAKFNCLHTFGKIHGAHFRAAKAYFAVELVILRSQYKKRYFCPFRRTRHHAWKRSLRSTWWTKLRTQTTWASQVPILTFDSWPNPSPLLLVALRGLSALAARRCAMALQRRRLEIQFAILTPTERVCNNYLLQEGVGRYFDLAEIAVTSFRPEKHFFCKISCTHRRWTPCSLIAFFDQNHVSLFTVDTIYYLRACNLLVVALHPHATHPLRPRLRFFLLLSLHFFTTTHSLTPVAKTSVVAGLVKVGR